MRILFIGHNGYGYPHTRVRCYHFARILSTMPDVETAVLSFRDDLAPHKSEAAMYENLRDREKLVLTWKAMRRLMRERDSVLYIQKAHFHAAAPYFLHRLGFFPDYVLDYDDYDIPLSNFFYRGTLNRFFFGSNRWDEITYRLARRARGCVAASRALAEILRKENPRVAYIPTGVDDAVFTPPPYRPDSRCLTFLWNGLVWGDPIVANILFMLRGLSRVASNMPDYRLLMVGGGASWESLRQTVKTDFPELAIEWRGWVEPQKMPEFLREADVGLLPACGEDLWLRSKSPTKLFEYMATGLPVVASQVGEAAQALDHLECGYLARDEREFGEGMLRLAMNADLRRKLGDNARKKAVEQYSLPVLGENLYLFLKDILQ
ncbi:MAG: glycosyltransferase [Candidatus Omnitrophota bacterium]